MVSEHSRFRKRILLCVASALACSLAYPPYDVSVLIWGGLLPFLMALNGLRSRTAFGLGYVTGVLFFSATLYWFVHVTLPGAILLILYLSVYWGLFALGPAFVNGRSLIFQLIFLSSWWVSLEYLRGHFLSGFGWVFLGHSQYKNIPLIQMADVTGVYGLSFLIVFSNAFFKEVVCRWALWRTEARFRREILVGAGVMAALLGCCLWYGYCKSAGPVFARRKVAVIQPNIPQEMKWRRSAWPEIMERFFALTKDAAREKPDLIVWPETAFPGFIWEDPALFEKLKELAAQLQTPILLGVVNQTGETYFNSAVLVSQDGQLSKRYDKLHLVPFGEYLPLRGWLPFLTDLIPIGDFSPGKSYTLFPVPQKDSPVAGKEAFYSVLICFEDTVPELARGFALKGSQLFINITNDAWFGDTRAPFLHRQAAVFRAVENRRGLIRCANTGVSCFIHPSGRILKEVRSPSGRLTYEAGYASQDMSFYSGQTFYTRWGDIFTYLCFGMVFFGMIKHILTRQRPKY